MLESLQWIGSWSRPFIINRKQQKQLGDESSCVQFQLPWQGKPFWKNCKTSYFCSMLSRNPVFTGVWRLLETWYLFTGLEPPVIIPVFSRLTTNGLSHATVLRSSVCRLPVCGVCIVAKWCTLKHKAYRTAYMKLHVGINWYQKWMTLTLTLTFV